MLLQCLTDKPDHADVFLQSFVLFRAEGGRSRKKVDLSYKFLHEPVILRHRNPVFLHESAYFFFCLHNFNLFFRWTLAL